jgi:hypothetical protein
MVSAQRSYHVPKKSTLQKVTDTVKDAAAAVVHAADDHVVQPVGKALGLVKEEPPKSKSAIKAARKLMIQSLIAKKKGSRAVGMSTRVESTKSKMNVPTSSGKVPSVRRGASKGR